MSLKSYGLMTVDWEERVNVERLRTERLARIKRVLKESDLGALLCFDMTNVRYITATHLGTWAMDNWRVSRYFPATTSLFFGTSARRHATTSCIVPGLATVHGRAFPRSEARCSPRLDARKPWRTRFAWNSKSVA